MKDSAHLSKKGTLAAHTPMRIDLELYAEAISNRYHPKTNPTGAFPMNVAENHLCWKMLCDRVEEVQQNKSIPDWVASYTDPVGAPSFRKAVAEFLATFLTKTPVDPDSLALSSGATSVIEMTAFLLANPGDTAVIPAPAYPVYSGDIGALPSVNRHDLPIPQDFSTGEYAFTLDCLDQAKVDIENKGSHFRLLILTHPDNPTGKIYPEPLLRSISTWCIQHQVHLIVNEIYGLSQIDIQQPQLKDMYPNPCKFQSFGKVMADFKSPFLHYWYSFSKDFGISGFRIGLLYSHNSTLIDAYRNVGLGHSIANPTQWIMQEVLDDLPFLQDFFLKNQHALTLNYIQVVEKLNFLRIPFNPSRGSLFVWFNLSEFLPTEADEAEEKLWIELYKTTGILLTPPRGFGHQARGWFRMVISSLSFSELGIALERLENFVREKRK